MGVLRTLQIHRFPTTENQKTRWFYSKVLAQEGRRAARTKRAFFEGKKKTTFSCESRSGVRPYEKVNRLKRRTHFGIAQDVWREARDYPTMYATLKIMTTAGLRGLKERIVQTVSHWRAKTEPTVQLPSAKREEWRPISSSRSFCGGRVGSSLIPARKGHFDVSQHWRRDNDERKGEKVEKKERQRKKLARKALGTKA